MLPILLFQAYALPTIPFEFIVTDVRPEQPEKAPFPMLVTLLGIVIDVRPEQP